MLTLHVANTLWTRWRGLNAYPPVERTRIALLLQPCRTIHTYTMQADIDVVFIDKYGAILRYCPNTPKNRIRTCRQAWAVLEAPAGQGLQAWRLLMRELQGGVRQK